MIILGLTGSIGMGKTTAAKMLTTLGVPVHDSDAQVHRLMAEDTETLAALKKAFPFYAHFQLYGSKDKNGIRRLDRKKLGEHVFKKSKEREKLEAILHPKVRDAQNQFISVHKQTGADIIALDIPLLFETGADRNVDYTLVVSAPAFIQEQRVLSRPNMNQKKFQSILKSQMPDAEKCARADYIIPTGIGHAETMKALKEIIHNFRTSGDKTENNQSTEKEAL